MNSITGLSPRPPDSKAGVFFRSVVAFAVGGAIGLAPFLGKVGVPGFESLYSALPVDSRGGTIAFGSITLACVAAIVQFLAGYSVHRVVGPVVFSLAVASFGGALFSLNDEFNESVYDYVVGEANGEQASIPVVLGRGYTGHRLDGCKCDSSLSIYECISGRGGPDQHVIEGCWSAEAIRVARTTIRNRYYLSIVAFAAVIGSLVSFPKKRRGAP